MDLEYSILDRDNAFYSPSSSVGWPKCSPALTLWRFSKRVESNELVLQTISSMEK